jgi:hypothetical protein
VAEEHDRYVPGSFEVLGWCRVAWRRAALAIEDYRTLSGHDSPAEAIGLVPFDPAAGRAYVRAQRAIGEVRNERERRHGGIER